MRERPTIDLATLRFEGARFTERGVETACTQEIILYGLLVLECAKALWIQRNDTGAPLPKRFMSQFRLQVESVNRQCAPIAVRRICGSKRAMAGRAVHDEFDEAALLIDALFLAVGRGQPIPPAYPPDARSVLSLFGETLREGETIFTRARSSEIEVPFDLRVRAALMREIGAPDIPARTLDSTDPILTRVLEELAEIGACASRSARDVVPGSAAPKRDKLH